MMAMPRQWESQAYKEARRCRSAVESLMFTIKDGFEFGQLDRRGIEAVRAELLEKVLASDWTHRHLRPGNAG